MKIKEGYMIRDVGGQAVIIPVGDRKKDFSGLVKLNDTAKIIWESLTEECTVEEIALKLVEKYGIPKDKALGDVEKFVENMKKEGFLCE